MHATGDPQQRGFNTTQNVTQFSQQVIQAAVMPALSMVASACYFLPVIQCASSPFIILRIRQNQSLENLFYVWICNRYTCTYGTKVQSAGMGRSTS
jgi:hypothetical protein